MHRSLDRQLDVVVQEVQLQDATVRRRQRNRQVEFGRSSQRRDLCGQCGTCVVLVVAHTGRGEVEVSYQAAEKWVCRMLVLYDGVVGWKE